MVIDASALLALLNEEVGSDIVLDALSGAIISAVNASEVATVLARNGVPIDKSKSIIQELIPRVVDFNLEQAFFAAELYKKTKSQGLSLGDRSCLALAKQTNTPVLTADKVWSSLRLGIKIELIR